MNLEVSEEASVIRAFQEVLVVFPLEDVFLFVESIVQWTHYVEAPC